MDRVVIDQKCLDAPGGAGRVHLVRKRFRIRARALVEVAEAQDEAGVRGAGRDPIERSRGVASIVVPVALHQDQDIGQLNTQKLGWRPSRGGIPCGSRAPTLIA